MMNILHRGIRLAWMSCLVLLLWDSANAQPQGERWFRLPNLPNGRDAGGVLGEKGYIPRGILYRSNQPLYLTLDECAFFQQRQVRTVVDFRYEAQRVAAPIAPCLAAQVTYVPVGIWSDADFSVGLTLQELYLMAVNTYAASFQTMFEILAEPRNLPVLIHCVAGKDRTGMAVALIYLLAGVPQEEVMAEYLRSNEVGFGVDSSWLQAVLDAVAREGGIEAFLAARGVSPALQAAVQASLLETPSHASVWAAY